MESDKVSMSLDDIIKMNKSGGRGRGRGRRGASVGGASSSFLSRANNSGRGKGNFKSPRRGGPRGGGVTKRTPVRNSNNFIPRNMEGLWTHDLFEGATAVNIREEGKLLISNLEYGVNDTDMKQLFSEFGQLKKAAVHYDASGRSLGTAEVIFSSKRDAIRAMNQYNTVPLDGRPMKIQIVESSLAKKPAAIQIAPTVTRGRGNTRGAGQTRSFIAGQKFRGRATSNVTVKRGAGRGGRGGRGRGGQRVTLTKEQLDEQLDNYNRMDTE